jgi:opacity protein-like surface antigen
VNTPSRPGWRLSAVVLVGLLHFGAASADAQERFKFGMTEFTFAGGYSIAHNTVGGVEVEDVDGFQLLPHFGIFLSDEHGKPGIRGNFELVVEPTLVHLRTDSESGTAGGLAALARWVFVTPWVVRPYLEVGLGILAGNFNLRQTNCDVNFIIEAGPGLLWFVSEQVAVTASYRYQHISNARTCSQNLGINSSLFIVGISYFFP